MLKLSGRITDNLERAATVLGALLLFIVVSLTGIEIVIRNYFGSSALEAVEISMQLAILMYFIGYPALLNGNRDIQVDYFYVKYPIGVQKVVDVLTNLAILCFFSIFLWKSIELFMHGLIFRHPVFNIPNAVVIVPVVLGGVFGLIVAIRRLADSLAETYQWANSRKTKASGKV